jgi:hypothetical protein
MACALSFWKEIEKQVCASTFVSGVLSMLPEMEEGA